MDRKRVLIVDDDIPLSNTVRESLEGADLEVKIARNVAEGSEFLKSFAPHAIVLDFDLGVDETGLDFLKGARAYDKYVPIILFSAKATPENKDDVVRADIDFILEKSEDPDLLERVVLREISKADETLPVLEEWLSKSQTPDTPLIVSDSGESYSLRQTVEEIRRATPLGRELLHKYKSGVLQILEAMKTNNAETIDD